MNNDTIFIRQETASDILKTQKVIQEAFSNVKESDQSEHELVNKLRKLPQFIPELSLVAESINREIVGHVLLSEVQVVSNERIGTLLALAPLAVSPAWQKQGIGSALVLGNPGYYSRFGYVRASEFGIMMPFPEHLDCCLAMALQPTGLDDMNGDIVYPKVFFE